MWNKNEMLYNSNLTLNLTCLLNYEIKFQKCLATCLECQIATSSNTSKNKEIHKKFIIACKDAFDVENCIQL